MFWIVPVQKCQGKNIHIYGSMYILNVYITQTYPPYAPVTHASLGIDGSRLKEGNPEALPLFLPLIIWSCPPRRNRTSFLACCIMKVPTARLARTFIKAEALALAAFKPPDWSWPHSERLRSFGDQQFSKNVVLFNSLFDPSKILPPPPPTPPPPSPEDLPFYLCVCLFVWNKRQDEKGYYLLS